MLEEHRIDGFDLPPRKTARECLSYLEVRSKSGFRSLPTIQFIMQAVQRPEAMDQAEVDRRLSLVRSLGNDAVDPTDIDLSDIVGVLRVMDNNEERLKETLICLAKQMEVEERASSLSTDANLASVSKVLTKRRSDKKIVPVAAFVCLEMVDRLGLSKFAKQACHRYDIQRVHCATS